mmetsp:Transcript_29128/g.64374  ORF Transcript_29128/g.64374 Transcript_29128/m.64374 type:complete len:475 (+) Transcript_29128:180-1604(+)
MWGQPPPPYAQTTYAPPTLYPQSAYQPAPYGGAPPATYGQQPQPGVAPAPYGAAPFPTAAAAAGYPSYTPNYAVPPGPGASAAPTAPSSTSSTSLYPSVLPDTSGALSYGAATASSAPPQGNSATSASAPPGDASKVPSAAAAPQYGQPQQAPQYGQSAAPQYGQAPLPGAYGQPALPAPTAMPAAAGPRRKALLVGCAYPRTSAELRGCINDAQCMAFCLKKHFGFTDSDIVLLRDDGQARSADFVSTRANIMRGIQWLTTDMQPGSSLVFHFSGHGSQKRSMYHDEEDGMDETICPSDYKTAGQIVDNELNQYLVNPLPTGVTLHCIVDACHSGTAFDLPFTTTIDRRTRLFTWRGTYNHYKGTRGGTAIQIGACHDSQVAQDTNSLSGRAYTGAATYSFIQAVEQFGKHQAYGQLLGNMTVTLERATGGSSASSGGGLFGLLLGGYDYRSDPQTPVLSCDKPLDLNTHIML